MEHRGGGRKPKTGQLRKTLASRFCNSRNFATYANKSTTTKKFNSNLVGIQFYGLKSPRISTCIIKTNVDVEFVANAEVRLSRTSETTLAGPSIGEKSC